ncbi:hypothetical protein SCHPADRAFT_890385 [Schizopora paradoxa]|uniref:DUF6533 domain-containing protein n=1 Tax=Schizopora paradoxa TaxID=27342 RepID=A0A0H2RN43_9AGAM|nr:hypothetical protein SCHPADRAFT_890385 [Schizopora paradoxa]
MDNSTLALASIVSSAASEIAASKYALLACYALLVYDFFLTQSDEVSYMWRGWKNTSLVSVVYFIVRRGVDFRISLFTYSFAHVEQKCKHFVPALPLGEGIPFSTMSNIIIGLRVYALYERNKFLGASIILFIIAELGVGLWLYCTPSLLRNVYVQNLPGPLPPPLNNSDVTIPALHLCFAVVSARIVLEAHGYALRTFWEAAGFQFMQAGYDSVAFALIVFKTFKAAFVENMKGINSIHSLIVKMVLYITSLIFRIVFSTNLAWALMIAFAPLNSKNIFARLTCVSINRLTLSLKSFSEREKEERLRMTQGVNMLAGDEHPRFKRRASWIGTSTFEIGSRQVGESTTNFTSIALYSRDSTLAGSA